MSKNWTQQLSKCSDGEGGDKHCVSRLLLLLLIFVTTDILCVVSGIFIFWKMLHWEMWRHVFCISVCLFLIHPVFPLIVSAVFLLLAFILSTQLLISICNLSLSSNTLPLFCLCSIQRHCVSPLIEFWSYPLRCSCFSCSYLMSVAVSFISHVLQSFQICFHGWLVIFFQQSVTFLFAWHISV